MGLATSDLIGVISNRITVDEIKPKIFKDGIVVVFSASNRDAALDLSSFIERGTPFTVDTEVSEFPNEDNNWLVYTEFERDDQFPKVLDDIITVLKKLTGNKRWKYMPYKGIRYLRYSKDSIKENIRLTSLKEKNILDESDLTSYTIKGNKLVTERHSAKKEFEFVGFKTRKELNIIVEQNKIDIQSNKHIEKWFGNDFESFQSGPYTIISKPGFDTSIVIRT